MLLENLPYYVWPPSVQPVHLCSLIWFFAVSMRFQWTHVCTVQMQRLVCIFTGLTTPEAGFLVIWLVPLKFVQKQFDNHISSIKGFWGRLWLIGNSPISHPMRGSCSVTVEVGGVSCKVAGFCHQNSWPAWYHWSIIDWATRPKSNKQEKLEVSAQKMTWE